MYYKIRFLDENDEIRQSAKNISSGSTLNREFQRVKKSQSGDLDKILEENPLTAKEKQCIGSVSENVMRLIMWGLHDTDKFLAMYGTKNYGDANINKAINAHRRLSNCGLRNNFAWLFGIYALQDAENIARVLMGRPKTKTISKENQERWRLRTTAR